jgi:hypothetical protein
VTSVCPDDASECPASLPASADFAGRADVVNRFAFEDHNTTVARVVQQCGIEEAAADGLGAHRNIQ